MSISNLLLQYGDRYVQALLTTWKLTAFSFAAAFVLGVFITVLRVCPIRPLRSAGEFYVQIFRNIPGAALLILLVYALPYLKILFSYGACVLIATSLIPSAFCSEHLMSGMNTIAPGQIEAARALGLTFFQMIRRIVIPQALRSTVLPMTNLLVATMLTTSLASQVPPAAHGADRPGLLYQHPRRGRRGSLCHLRRALLRDGASDRAGGQPD